MQMPCRSCKTRHRAEHAKHGPGYHDFGTARRFQHNQVFKTSCSVLHVHRVARPSRCTAILGESDWGFERRFWDPRIRLRIRKSVWASDNRLGFRGSVCKKFFFATDVNVLFFILRDIERVFLSEELLVFAELNQHRRGLRTPHLTRFHFNRSCIPGV